MFADFWKSVKDPELRMAWAVAVAADALQIGAFPLFAEGALSPLDSVLDLVVAFMLIRLVGWHWAFLPTIVAEALPGADLFPTWTAALLFVSHDRSRSSDHAPCSSAIAMVRIPNARELKLTCRPSLTKQTRHRRRPRPTLDLCHRLRQSRRIVAHRLDR